MAKKKSVCRTSSGSFVRNLGWKRAPSGYAQHKFHLGRDEGKAALANLRLEYLWAQVCRRWERDKGYELYPTDRAVWDEVALAIAEAVRNGQPVAKVPLPCPLSVLAPESALIGEWLDQLQADITVVKIELEDPQANENAEENLQKQGRRLLDMGRRMLHKKAGGETLHAALTAYGRWIESKFLDTQKRVTPWGRTQDRQVSFLRRNLPDVPLAALDAHRIEELFDVLRLRPTGDNGRQVSVDWSRNVIKQFRRFLRWLNRSPEFAWKRPADLEFGQVRIPLNPAEKGRMARNSQVETYNPKELQTLWEHASPFNRMMMLLALNCGFGSAELASLETADVLLRSRHPHEREVGHAGTDADSWVFRVRHKTGVYGEWKLWPETVAAIDWWQRRRAAIAVAANASTLLVNDKGLRYDAPTKSNNPNYQIPNGWSLLSKRIRKDHAEFRILSFNKLRKTAGNLVRSEAGGEAAGIFLCHGAPVPADALLDLYTNRPFAKVFSAIERVGEKLRPLWSGVEFPFPDQSEKSGPKISLATIRRIQAMKRQGYKTGYVAEKLGVSTETVRRWAKRSVDHCSASDGNDEQDVRSEA